MISDPIADLLIRIKNASLAGRREVAVPYSMVKENLAKILLAEGFLAGVKVAGEEPKKQLVLTLAETGGRLKAIEIRRISKPGKRVYAKFKDLVSYRRGLGILIVSTPGGLMTGREAVAKKLGGEVIGKVI